MKKTKVVAKRNRKNDVGLVFLSDKVNNRIALDSRFVDFCRQSLIRHTNCDWGDICQSDKKYNDEIIKTCEDSLRSAYIYDKDTGEKILIITECDHSITTILFPSEL